MWNAWSKTDGSHSNSDVKCTCCRVSCSFSICGWISRRASPSLMREEWCIPLISQYFGDNQPHEYTCHWRHFYNMPIGLGEWIDEPLPINVYWCIIAFTGYRTMSCLYHTSNSTNTNIIDMMLINTFDINCTVCTEYDMHVFTNNNTINTTVNRQSRIGYLPWRPYGMRHDTVFEQD